MSKEYLTNRQIALKVGGTPPSSYIDLFTAKEQAINFYGTIIDQTKLTSYPSGDFIVDDDIVKKTYDVAFQLGSSFEDVKGNYTVASNLVTVANELYTFSDMNSFLKINAKGNVAPSTNQAEFNLVIKFNGIMPSIPAGILTFKIFNGPFACIVLQYGKVYLYMGGQVGNSQSVNMYDVFTVKTILTKNVLTCYVNGATLYGTSCSEIDNRFFAVGENGLGEFRAAEITVNSFKYSAIV